MGGDRKQLQRIGSRPGIEQSRVRAAAEGTATASTIDAETASPAPSARRNDFDVIFLLPSPMRAPF